MPDTRDERVDIPGRLTVSTYTTVQGESLEWVHAVQPDTTALLVVSRGLGGAAILADGLPVGSTNTPETFARVEGNRVLAYAAAAQLPSQLTFKLHGDGDYPMAMTVIEVKRDQRGLQGLAHRLIPCWLCRRLVRSAFTALLSAAGVPDPGIAEALIDVVQGALEQLDELPEALASVLDRIFGDHLPGLLEQLREFVDNLPLNHAARRICEWLRLCP